MNIRSLVIIFALTLSPFCSAEVDTPESLAMEYFEAMENEGMTLVGRFMHPDALANFKSMMMPVFEFEVESGERQLLDLTFGPSATISELQDSDSVSFMNGFMNIIVSQLDSAKVSFDKIEIIGTLDEGQNKHVLTRVTVGSGEVSLTQFEVLSFKPYKDTWRLLLNGQMKGLANSLRANLPNE